jgi:hypothetical protein
MKKRPLTVNTYSIVARAVEEGVGWGYLRAHKHDPNPSEAIMKEHMEREVMNALCEVVDFGKG